MSALRVLAGLLVAGPEEEVPHTDSEGIVTHHPLWPEGYELLWFGIAVGVLVLLIAWKGRAAIRAVKNGLQARTDRVQKELDEAARVSAEADAEAARIRQALGDIGAERERMLAEADRQAAAVLEEGRARLAQEIRETEARGAADIAAARGRAGEELRAEIARLSSAAIEQVVSGTLDGATHQQLIEHFINRVGTGSVTV